MPIYSINNWKRFTKISDFNFEFVFSLHIYQFSLQVFQSQLGEQELQIIMAMLSWFLYSSEVNFIITTKFFALKHTLWVLI